MLPTAQPTACAPASYQLVSRADGYVPHPGPELWDDNPWRGIYRLDLEGEVGVDTRADEVLQELARAEADPAVRAVVVVVDSPGGYTQGVASLAAALQACRKPTLAYVVGMATSAAWWVATACGAVWAASPDCRVGGVGAYMQLVDASGMLERMGIRTTTVYSTHSPRKNAAWRAALEGDTAPLLRTLLDPLVRDFQTFALRTARARLQGARPQRADDLMQGADLRADEAAAAGWINGIIAWNELMAQEDMFRIPEALQGHTAQDSAAQRSGQPVAAREAAAPTVETPLAEIATESKPAAGRWAEATAAGGSQAATAATMDRGNSAAPAAATPAPQAGPQPAEPAGTPHPQAAPADAGARAGAEPTPTAPAANPPASADPAQQGDAAGVGAAASDSDADRPLDCDTAILNRDAERPLDRDAARPLGSDAARHVATNAAADALNRDAARHVATNAAPAAHSMLEDTVAEIAALEATVAALRAELEALRAAPAPAHQLRPAPEGAGESLEEVADFCRAHARNPAACAAAVRRYMGW